MTRPRWSAVGLVIGIVVMSGCGTGQPARGPSAPAGSWKVVAAADLGESQRNQKDRAVAAREAMYTRLVSRLGQALGQGGPAAAIPVCQKEAPEIAGQVAREYQVAIGRTSFKLRNAANAPPEWAKPLVADKPAEPVYLAGPDGWLAAFLPIRLQATCITCHGTNDTITPETRQALARYYPQDQATGFQDGDLRGWFWVEVGPGKK